MFIRNITGRFADENEKDTDAICICQIRIWNNWSSHVFLINLSCFLVWKKMFLQLRRGSFWVKILQTLTFFYWKIKLLVWLFIIIIILDSKTFYTAGKWPDNFNQWFCFWVILFISCFLFNIFYWFFCAFSA